MCTGVGCLGFELWVLEVLVHLCTGVGVYMWVCPHVECMVYIRYVCFYGSVCEFRATDMILGVCQCLCGCVCVGGC